MYLFYYNKCHLIKLFNFILFTVDFYTGSVLLYSFTNENIFNSKINMCIK